ncbi:MAG: GGDEF domain-containing protein [Spirochaetes bacterium]|nr:GGDEF domain-containing protein [Spirochaetota bacterium]
MVTKEKNNIRNILNSVSITVLSLVLVALIGLADYSIGKKLSFSVFYLIPILFLLWFQSGRTAGFLISAICTLVWFMADTKNSYADAHFLVPYWNAFVRFSVFMVFVFLLTSLKRSLMNEKIKARTDFITGISNSQSFFEDGGKEVKRCIRYKHPVSIAYLDCDNFKMINDTLGHKAGDELLRLIARLLLGNIRENDLAARLGGDEFVILFPETNDKSAVKVMSRIQKVLLSTMIKNKLDVTFSIGLASYNHPTKLLEEILNKADDLMYLAKKKGKNRICSKIFN